MFFWHFIQRRTDAICIELITLISFNRNNFFGSNRTDIHLCLECHLVVSKTTKFEAIKSGWTHEPANAKKYVRNIARSVVATDATFLPLEHAFDRRFIGHKIMELTRVTWYQLCARATQNNWSSSPFRWSLSRCAHTTIAYMQLHRSRNIVVFYRPSIQIACDDNQTRNKKSWFRVWNENSYSKLDWR